MLRTHFSYFHWAGLSGQLFKQLAFSFNENPFVFPNILGRTSIFLNQGSCVNTGTTVQDTDWVELFFDRREWQHFFTDRPEAYLDHGTSTKVQVL